MDSHINRMWVTVLTLRGKIAVLVSLRVFSLEKSTAGVFAVPFRVLTEKNMTEECVM